MFCSLKDIVKGRKRQIIDLEKILAKHIFDKELMYLKYKKSSQ